MVASADRMRKALLAVEAFRRERGFNAGEWPFTEVREAIGPFPDDAKSPPDPSVGRCVSIGPEPQRFRCGLHAGHNGEHTALIASGAPWFAAHGITDEATP